MRIARLALVALAGCGSTSPPRSTVTLDEGESATRYGLTVTFVSSGHAFGGAGHGVLLDLRFARNGAEETRTITDTSVGAEQLALGVRWRIDGQPGPDAEQITLTIFRP